MSDFIDYTLSMDAYLYKSPMRLHFLEVRRSCAAGRTRVSLFTVTCNVCTWDLCPVGKLAGRVGQGSVENLMSKSESEDIFLI